MKLDMNAQTIPQKNAFHCGAASCLYILKLLNVADPNDDLDTVFEKTCVIGCAPWLGSSPSNIANLIEKRCASKNKKIKIQRIRVADYGGRPWIHALKHNLKKYTTLKSEPIFTDDDIVLRFLNISGSIESHFIVQTNFRGGMQGDSQFFDPVPGKHGRLDYENSFNDWLNSPLRAGKAAPTGLDLMFTAL